MTDASSRRRLILFVVPLVLIAGAAQMYFEGTSAFPFSLFRSAERERSGEDVRKVHEALGALAIERKILLAKSMPHFLAHLERQRRMDIRYKSEAGTDQRILVYLNERQELVVEQDMPVGTRAELANGIAKPIHITLIDRNRDGALDFVRFQRGTDAPRDIESPRDEASLGLWDIALSIAFTTSRCCEVGGTLPSNTSLERTRDR